MAKKKKKKKRSECGEKITTQKEKIFIHDERNNCFRLFEADVGGFLALYKTMQTVQHGLGITYITIYCCCFVVYFIFIIVWNYYGCAHPHTGQRWSPFSLLLMRFLIWFERLLTGTHAIRITVLNTQLEELLGLTANLPYVNCESLFSHLFVDSIFRVS